MANRFRTEAEIERDLERSSITLRDSAGNAYRIEAASFTWEWFLIFTTDADFAPEIVMDDVLQWQKTEHPGQELSNLFSQYMDYLIDEAGPELRSELLRNFRKGRTHPLLDRS